MKAIKPHLFILILSAFLSPLIAFSQDTGSVAAPDPERSVIRSLSDQEYLDFKYGREMGMSRVAELNNYPGPEDVKQLQDQLQLSGAQKSELQKIISAWQFKTREMGGFILAQESRLNKLFESGKATDGAVIYYTNKIGLYLGELRNAHLQAHLKTRKILTQEQIRKYYRIKAATK